jgi:DNA-binding transcriptional LysR family regulator
MGIDDLHPLPGIEHRLDLLDRDRGQVVELLLDERWRQGSGVLTVSTSPDFAAKWLVNRLGRFAEAPSRD